MNRHVFVYGTLQGSEPNHRMMAGARFVREARTAPLFTLLDLGPFPALREGGSTAVRGEVYEVTPEHLARLDRFEGVPRLYERAEFRLDRDDVAEAYVQRGPARTGALIASGDWRAYRKGRGHASEVA